MVKDIKAYRLFFLFNFIIFELKTDFKRLIKSLIILKNIIYLFGT